MISDEYTIYGRLRANIILQGVSQQHALCVLKPLTSTCLSIYLVSYLVSLKARLNIFYISLADFKWFERPRAVSIKLKLGS